MSTTSVAAPPVPANEPVLDYAPGSPERASLQQVLTGMEAEVLEISSVIGGERVETGDLFEVRMPCDHQHVLARVHAAGPEEVVSAIDAAREARGPWAAASWEDRAAVLLKAADLLSGPWRDVLNASTMLGQGKTVHQAEIDAACELADFFRFNVHYMRRILAEQPESAPGTWNRMDWRPLDGFVFAVTPFNFTSIAGNLPTAPALMGNTVVWKPARTQALSAWFIHELLREAGMPPGVINLVQGSGRTIGRVALGHPDLGGIHFTGSTATFQGMWRTVGERIATYRQYPRLVGETGGKDFILAHPSADVLPLAVAIVRGGFEYQGQKCSAASRVYVPSNLWNPLLNHLRAMMGELRMGDVRDFSTFVGAVIDRAAWEKLTRWQATARETATVLVGGGADASVGWYVEPTLVQVEDPAHPIMQTELFGPIVSVYVYPETDFEGALGLVDGTSPYGLTGSIFARDREAIDLATRRLRHAAGNFYINDKPTGAVVGQQPFGGGRASGTNDKAGSMLNLLRWTSPRSIKETFRPPTDWRYPYLG